MSTVRTSRSLRRIAGIAAAFTAAIAVALPSTAIAGGLNPSSAGSGAVTTQVSSGVGNQVPRKGSGTATDGLSQFGSCLAGSGKGSFVLLIDQSGSLKKTDPDKARVTAGHYVVDRLAALAASTKGDLQVRVAGFAANYNPEGDWTSVSDSSADAVKAAVTAVGNNIQTHDTDYWNALEGARQDLTDHDTSGCRAIAWFSDGAFDLDVRSSSVAKQRYGTEKSYAAGQSLDSEAGVSAAERAGLADLCRPTGVADQLRAAGITLVGVGLDKGGTDFATMKRVALGGGENAKSNAVEQCGDQASPPGSFYTVSDIDSLLLAFDSISAASGSLEERSVKICQGQVCRQGETAFVLDGSLNQVHILASASVEGLDAYLYQPGSNEALILSSKQSDEQNNNGIVSRWITPKSLEITLATDSLSTWDGVWRLAFVDAGGQTEGKEVRINLTLSSPAQLVWEKLDSTPLRLGETVKDATITLMDGPDGKPVDLTRITGTLSAAITLQDAQGKKVTLFKADSVKDLEGTHAIKIPTDVGIGNGELTTSVALTTPTAKLDDGTELPGTTLTPTAVTHPVTVEPPLNFPKVASSLVFPLMEKDTTTHADLAINGPGCVWLDPASVSFTGKPGEAGKVTMSADASSQASCVTLAKGETGNLPVTLTAEGQANGAVSGTVTVMIAPADKPKEARPVAVTFSGEMRRPLNVGMATATFVIALLLGLGLPIGLLYLFKFLSARIPGGTVVVGSAVVTLPEGGGAPQVSISSDRLTQTSIKRSRELTLGGVTLRARSGWSPASVPSVRLAQPDALAVSDALPSDRKGRAILPLNVRGHWLAVLDQPDSPRQVRVVIIASTIHQSVIDRLCQDASARVANKVKGFVGRHEDRLPGGGKPAAPDKAPGSVLGSGSSGAPSASGPLVSPTPAAPFGGVTSPSSVPGRGVPSAPMPGVTPSPGVRGASSPMPPQPGAVPPSGLPAGTPPPPAAPGYPTFPGGSR